ncbi:hypothetical protein N0V84_007406 [Fusarium piperis]|uniref:Protein kinase domain-containing protein n=1 Tax=Fusarium piperis TaxID=1435070 RepID=A0A9W9BLQ7_9HYPO|nr:hypothetical protein N0V84_007406 [Fusarium piperis]
MERDDSNLPFWEIPYAWKESLGKFWDEQWMFCPLEFSKELIFKRKLHARQILPVTYRESLRPHALASDGPSIRKVEIHPACNTMTEANTPVVFKVFRGSGLETMYQAEANTYKRLRERPVAQKTIATHYGSFSFEETDTRIIILEYAVNGSLLDFFKKASPPVTPEESKLLWKAMFALLQGLYALHNLDRQPIEGDPANVFTAAIHGDIKPDNILVFPCAEKSTHGEHVGFNVRFKLADFGLAESGRVSKINGHIKIKNEGNRMYSAPECYPNYAVQSQLRPVVTPKADVWSLGAVYSEVLVWSIAGELRRNEYCLSWSPPTSDRGPMSRVGEDGMMHKNDQRRPSHPRSTTPHTEPPATSHRAAGQTVAPKPSNGQAPPVEELYVEELYEKLWKKKSKGLSIGRARDMFQRKHSDISIELPQMESAWSLIKAKDGRDQIILIDNFISMQPYIKEVAKTARVVSYVTKVADTDGMDLFFASDSTKSQKHTTSTTVESAIKGMKLVKGKCNMKNCLHNITKAVFKDGIKPTSIYVYTDAVWEDADEVANVIKKSIARLVEAKEDPSTLMFQFIQFGNDKDGTICLQKLDNECKEKHGTVE